MVASRRLALLDISLRYGTVLVCLLVIEAGHVVARFKSKHPLHMSHNEMGADAHICFFGTIPLDI